MVGSWLKIEQELFEDSVCLCHKPMTAAIFKLVYHSGTNEHSLISTNKGREEVLGEWKRTVVLPGSPCCFSCIVLHCLGSKRLPLLSVKMVQCLPDSLLPHTPDTLSDSLPLTSCCQAFLKAEATLPYNVSIKSACLRSVLC